MNKLIFLFIYLLITASVCCAQKQAFIYIQGDKATPFYVKLQGKMQPRYGKNYCIISGLPAGGQEIEILFQQNIYPPQAFSIPVAENGYRSLMLTKKDKEYELYDLATGSYIRPTKK